MIASLVRSQQLDLWWRRGPTPIAAWFIPTGARFLKSLYRPKSQFNKLILVPNCLNCYLTPEDRGPPTPQKHPPCYNTEQMTGLLHWCLRVGVSKCVCFRVWQHWGDRNQESCAIRHFTRSCILDLDTYGSGTSVDILLRLNVLIMYTDTPHYIYIYRKKIQVSDWKTGISLTICFSSLVFDGKWQHKGRLSGLWSHVDYFSSPGGNLDGERGRVKSGVLPGGTLTSQLVYLNGTASLWDLSGLIWGDKGRIFLRRCYFNTRIHTRTHTEVS